MRRKYCISIRISLLWNRNLSNQMTQMQGAHFPSKFVIPVGSESWNIFWKVMVEIILCRDVKLHRQNAILVKERLVCCVLYLPQITSIMQKHVTKEQINWLFPLYPVCCFVVFWSMDQANSVINLKFHFKFGILFFCLQKKNALLFAIFLLLFTFVSYLYTCKYA